MRCLPRPLPCLLLFPGRFFPCGAVPKTGNDLSGVPSALPHYFFAFYVPQQVWISKGEYEDFLPIPSSDTRAFRCNSVAGSTGSKPAARANRHRSRPVFLTVLRCRSGLSFSEQQFVECDTTGRLHCCGSHFGYMLQEVLRGSSLYGELYVYVSKSSFTGSSDKLILAEPGKTLSNASHRHSGHETNNGLSIERVERDLHFARRASRWILKVCCSQRLCSVAVQSSCCLGPASF